MIAVQVPVDAVERRLRETFQDGKRLADARKVLELMRRSQLIRSWLEAFVVFAFAGVVFGILREGWAAAGFLFVALLLGYREWAALRENSSEKVVKARAELETLMEFDHVQFPYWKGIAEKLKKILEEEGLYRRSMLPSHVLDSNK